MAINIAQVGNAPIAPPTQPTLQQEAFTAVLPTTENLNQQMLQSVQLKHAMDEADKQRKKKEIADQLKMFDINAAGVWDKGMPIVQEKIDAGLKKFNTPEFLAAYDNGELWALREHSNWKNDVMGTIETEQLAPVAYKQYQNLLDDPKYHVYNEKGENVNDLALQEWLDKKQHSLGDLPDFQTQVYNPSVDAQYISTFNKEGSISVPQADGSVKSESVNIVDLPSAVKGLKTLYSDQEHKNGLINTKLFMMQQDPETMIDIYYDPKTNEFAKPIKTIENGVNVIKYQPLSQKSISDPTLTNEEFALANGMSANKYGKFTQHQTEASNSDGGDEKNGVVVQYKQNVPLSMDVAQIDEKTGQIGAKDVKTLTMKGGWDVSSIFNEPATVYISSVDKWIPVDKNVTKDKIPKKTGAQKVDIVKILDVPLDDDNTIRDLSNSTKTERMALVSLNGLSFLIPYNKDVEQKLYDFAKTNSKLDNFEGLFDNKTSTTTAPTNTGTKPKEDLRKKYNY